MADDDHFNIFEEFQEWSHSLKPWERHALAILTEKGSIGDDELEAIYEQFKRDYELLPPADKTPTHKLVDSFTPQKIDKNDALALEAVSSVKGVNAIVEGEELHFGPSLTVVYGPNGSGKSGYARIFKDACFTRSPNTMIHGNVHIPIDQRGEASAVFKFSNGSTVQYKQGQPCPIMRDNYAVFDTSCVRVYMDEQNEFMVRPYGFDVFTALVELFGKLKTMLDSEIEEKKTDLSVFELPDSDTEVANILNNLGYETDLKRLKELGVFTEENGRELIAIEKEINDLTKKDQTGLISQKRGQGKAVKSAITRIVTIDSILRPENFKELKEVIAEIQTLKEKIIAASAAEYKDEPVQPIGSDTWVSLIEAAIKFSEEEAYPGKPFPLDGEDAKCVLCHQTLSQDAKNRLKRFLNTVRSEYEIKLRKLNEQLKTIFKKYDDLDLSFLNETSVIHSLIESCDQELLMLLGAYIKAAEDFRSELILSMKNLKWAVTKELPEIPGDECKEVRINLAKSIKDLRKDDKSKRVKALEGRLKLLNDQKILNKNLGEIIKSVINLKWVNAAEPIRRGALNPRHVTDKERVLSQQLIAKGYKDKFKEECRELRFRLPIDFKIAGSGGVTYRSLQVGNDNSKPLDPSEILSEGEQKAVALADFLTEINLNEAPIGIVFDDPVISMDHCYKEQIAYRLAKEASIRQVIIFTHDIIFAHHLAMATIQLGPDKVSFQPATISANSADLNHGYVDRVIFPHVYYDKDTNKQARKYLDQARKLTGEQQNDKLVLGCGALRAAYENFIQVNLFNDVICRWRESMKPTALKGIYISQEAIDVVVQRYEYLSRYEKGHSHTPEYNETPLTIEVLEKELADFKDLADKYKKEAQKHIEKRSAEKKAVFLDQDPD